MTQAGTAAADLIHIFSKRHHLFITTIFVGNAARGAAAVGNLRVSGYLFLIKRGA